MAKKSVADDSAEPVAIPTKADLIAQRDALDKAIAAYHEPVEFPQVLYRDASLSRSVTVKDAEAKAKALAEGYREHADIRAEIEKGDK